VSGKVGNHNDLHPGPAARAFHHPLSGVVHTEHRGPGQLAGLAGEHQEKAWAPPAVKSLTHRPVYSLRDSP
jgi:hypothetical protein